MIGLLRLNLRLIATVLWIIIIIPPLFITWQLRLERANSSLMMFSFYVGALIWGVKTTIIGRVPSKRPLLIVSNHFSYLDVFALGSKVPARFITKNDVASWPIIGFVCKIGGCIFIDRKKNRTLHNMSELNQAVEKRSIITLFPEGTTNDGKALLPFRSSFFSIAEDMDVTVQPVSIVYEKLSGIALDEARLGLVGWYGDAEFFPHALRFLREESVEVTLVFHEPLTNEKVASRKDMALYCHQLIQDTLYRYKKSAPENGGAKPNNGG